MSYIYQDQERLYANALKDVWEKINPEYRTALGISAGDDVVTAREQFEAFFYGRLLIHDNLKILVISFKIIFYDNLFLIKQIENYKKICAELSDFDNWQDVTKIETTGKSSFINKTKNENININATANTDANSRMEESELNGYMDLDGNKTIPANTLTQLRSKVKDDGEIMNDSTNENKTKTASSNSSQDYRAYLSTEITQLRNKFWWKFITLFQ